MLKRINVTLESWQQSLDIVRQLIDYVSATFGESDGNILYSEDGLPQVPVTNKQWASWIGYEHDEQTLWFRPIVKRQLNGFLARQPYGAKALLQLARSVVWNTALYIHFLRNPLHPRAMYRAVAQSLVQDSTCPQELIEPLASQISRLCYRILVAISDSDGDINRCGVQLLKDNLDTTLRGRSCTNKALRRSVCLQLVAQGIGGLETRIQQRNRILRVLKGYPALKGSAVRSIERMLTVDKELLGMNGGVAILLPYTDADKKNIYSTVQTQRRLDTVQKRVQAICEKLRAGEKLTAAERTFNSRHKDLFEQ